MDYKLKFENTVPKVWETLGKIQRTGWVIYKVKNPETVQEHTLACIDFVLYLRNAVPEFTKDDINIIITMLEVHDFPEVITGDVVSLAYKPTKDRLEKEKDKFISEQDAMFKIIEGLGNAGYEIFDFWYRYARGKDKLASFARQVDKFQVIEKAWEYQQKGENVSVLEFIHNHKNEIVHPLLTVRIENLKSHAKNAH